MQPVFLALYCQIACPISRKQTHCIDSDMYMNGICFSLINHNYSMHICQSCRQRATIIMQLQHSHTQVIYVVSKGRLVSACGSHKSPFCTWLILAVCIKTHVLYNYSNMAIPMSNTLAVSLNFADLASLYICNVSHWKNYFQFPARKFLIKFCQFFMWLVM